MPNIEIKARYPSLERARAICAELGAQSLGVDSQSDTYFCVPNGRLKLRRSSLHGDMLIPYLRPDQAGPKQSEYVAIPIQDSAATEALLARILGVELVVKKERELFLLGNVRIHLDRVQGLGNFFEFEAVYSGDDAEARAAEVERVTSLMAVFGIEEAALEKASYQQLAAQA